jgi:repressor of nif and glnA expression
MNEIVCEISQIYKSSRKAWEKVIELLVEKKISTDDRIQVIKERCL